MLDTLITSKTRIKLLTKFFLNPQAKAYLRGLEESFGESSNAVRVELNRFEQAGLLNSVMEGNRKVYIANTTHPLFPDIHSILRKQIGIDHIIELYLIGTDIDEAFLEQLRAKAASIINRSIKLTLHTPTTFTQLQNKINPAEIFLLWESK